MIEQENKEGEEDDSPRRFHRGEALLLHPGSWVERLRLESQAPGRAAHMHRAQHRHLLLTAALKRSVAEDPFPLSLDSPSQGVKSRSPHCTGAA